MSVVSLTDFKDEDLSIKSDRTGHGAARKLDMRTEHDARRIRAEALAKSPSGSGRPSTAPFQQASASAGNISKLAVHGPKLRKQKELEALVG